MKRRKISNMFFLLCVVFWGDIIVNAQTTSAGSSANYESRYIVDMPNAGLLKKSYYAINSQLVSNGGILLDFVAAPFDFLNIGVSYACYGVVGGGEITGQDIPGFNVKLRPFDETKALPAIAVGFYSQGKGLYFKNIPRFEQMAPGFFLSASKNYLWALGSISIHAAINYSLESSDEKGINMYGGIEQSIGRYAAIYFEINPNLNNTNKNILENSFMLNASIKANIFKNISIELQLRDLLKNSNCHNKLQRFLGIEFINKF